VDRPRRGPWLALALLGTALALAPPSPARADEESTALERRVKAAFLYKFAGYVEWPAAAFDSAQAPVNIAVMGDDAIAAELEQLVVGRTSGGRPVAVRRIESLDDSGPLHILFIGRSESGRLRSLIRGAGTRAVLIVTETPGALAMGSMINFVLADGRVRFEVALAAVEKRGLSLSSRLLAVARSVVTGTP
jgi:hypothetical protein